MTCLPDTLSLRSGHRGTLMRVRQSYYRGTPLLSPPLKKIKRVSSVQFSPWPIGSSEGSGTWGTIQQRSTSSPFIFFFFAGGPCEQFWHGQGCPLFDVRVVHSAFPLPTTASPTLQGALQDGFGEALLACDMPEPCKFPSLDSCQKRILWTHKQADPALSRWSCAPNASKGGPWWEIHLNGCRKGKYQKKKNGLKRGVVFH